VQVSQPELGPTSQRVAGVKPYRQAVIKQVCIGQSGEPVGNQRKRTIELARQDLPLKVLAQRLAQLELNRREPVDKGLGQREPALAPPCKRNPDD
jgi:hypothetical protein